MTSPKKEVLVGKKGKIDKKKSKESIHTDKSAPINQPEKKGKKVTKLSNETISTQEKKDIKSETDLSEQGEKKVNKELHIAGEHLDSLKTDLPVTLNDIRDLIERKIVYDETKERMFNVLYEQLKGYQKEFLESLQKPIINNLLVLYDDINKLKNMALIEISDKRVINGIEAIETELLNILYQLDIVPFEKHPEILDPKLHKTVKVVETTEITEDKKVVEILKAGFSWQDKILRPEEVIIKRFKELKTNEGGIS